MLLGGNRTLNQLSYKIEPSEFSNDHEVRLLVDGEDILGPEQLGLDPIDFLQFVRPDISGRVLVGRCDCGCIGCSDLFAEVQFVDHHVVWQLSGRTYQFEVTSYKSTLTDVASDQSWEDIGRRVERILSERVRIDDRLGTEATHFDWVSTRCSPHQLTYSFSTAGQQVTFSTGWDAKTEADAIAAHDRLFLERFSK